MKIEKVNDHQIKCTLTKADLADRELKISELAYGTEKAKSLFRDMMQQASFEFGFEAEDIPLMIEAIPINSECIVLIITKVEDPEELDTRFSKFAPSVMEDETQPSVSDTRDEVLDLFKKIHDEALDAISEAKANAEKSEKAAPKQPEKKAAPDTTYIFTFENMSVLSRCAHLTADWYDGQSTLYKDPASGQYKLVLRVGDASASTFNKACNIMTEYGSGHRFSPSGKAYFEEHFEMICPENALQNLSYI